ncbi:Leucine--tRNA ligase, partial [Dissostichus eleginoides]
GSALVSHLQPTLSSSPSILPATTHPLIVSAASANEGPQGPVHSHQGGTPMLHASFKTPVAEAVATSHTEHIDTLNLTVEAVHHNSSML